MNVRKFNLILVILLYSFFVLAQPGGINIRTYNFNIRMDLNARKMFVDVQLAMQRHDTSGEISVLLNHNATIISISSSGHPAIPFQFSGKDSLLIQLPPSSGKDKLFPLLFSYSLPADSFRVNRGMFVMKR